MFRSLTSVTVLIGILVPRLSTAQLTGPNIPDSLSIQGILTDTNGVAVPDGDYNLQFKLYEVGGGSYVWSDLKVGIPVESGLFNVILGGAGSSSLASVAFNEAMELGITPKPGITELTPRTPLTAVPYALAVRGFHAIDAESGDNRAPNIIAGASNNTVSSGLVGVTISGGGGEFFEDGGVVDGDWPVPLNSAKNQTRSALGTPAPNSVTGDWGTVGGGRGNLAYYRSVVAGGVNNQASGTESTVSGGLNNDANGALGVIGGGSSNVASGFLSTVPGGSNNEAAGANSFAAGRLAQANHDGAFVWSDYGDGATFASTGPDQFLVDASGGVGVNTNQPAAALHVVAGSQGVSGPHLLNEDLIVEGGDAVVGLYSAGGTGFGSTIVLAEMTSGPPPLVTNKWAIVRNASGSGAHLRFTYGTNINYSTNDTQMRIEPDGDVFADGGFFPNGADVAEAFDGIGEFTSYEPGDVLVISESIDRRVERSHSGYSTLVAGVYASKPGVLLSGLDVDADRSGKIPLAVVGVVPTKVTLENGPIRRGDLLVTSSTEAHAMRGDAENLGFGMVLGKALENFEGPGVGMIEVLVNVK